MTQQRRALGIDGEDRAAAWYRERGYTVLDRNWRCRDGELDLVVAKGRTVVFCEVKTRTTDAFGAASETVGHTKRARIRGLAARWLEEPPFRPLGIRFDVVAITAGDLEVIEGAF